MRRGICCAIFLAALLVSVGCAPAQPQAVATPPPTGAKPAKAEPTTSAPAAKPTVPTKPREIPATTAPVQSLNIAVTAPATGARVTSPVRVTGTARVYEANVELAVKDASGKVIGKAIALATAGAPEWGSFDAQIAFDAPRSEQQGTVEAFSLSARDGSVQDLVSVKVTLLPR